MLRKSVVVVAVCLLLAAMAGPAAAMLKVLEPAVSNELREIAREHVAEKYSVSADAVTIADGFVREYWNVGVDVYNVVALIDEGLATETRVEVPVRVDRKAVLSASELTALEEEDNALAPAEPVFRITAAEGGEPAADEALSGAGNTIYYITGAALVATLLGVMLVVRRRAHKI
jgi:hypothetical protein